MPCQAAVASCPDWPGYFQQCDKRANGSESAELDIYIYIDGTRMDLRLLLDTICAQKFSPKCVCHFSFAMYAIVLQVGRIFQIGIHSRCLSCRLGHPWPKGRLLFFPTSTSYEPWIIIVAMSTDMQYFASLTAVWFRCLWWVVLECLNRHWSPRVWTLRAVLTVRVATYPP